MEAVVEKKLPHVSSLVSLCDGAGGGESTSCQFTCESV